MNIRATITFPADLHREIRLIAKEQNRSMSRQIVHWLQFCVERHRARQRMTWEWGEILTVGDKMWEEEE